MHTVIPQVNGLFEDKENITVKVKDTQTKSKQSKESSNQTELKDLLDTEKFIKIEAIKIKGSRLTATLGGPRCVQCDQC